MVNMPFYEFSFMNAYFDVYVSQLYTREPPMTARIEQHSMIIIFFYKGVSGQPVTAW